MTPSDRASKPAPPLPIADVDRLADEIAEVASHIDAATHRLLTLIRRFDEGSGWSQHGALSCAHWLNWRIGLDLGAARERVRVARALGDLPALDDALRRGAVSYSKTRAITRVATADNEATLLDMARHATASQLEKICRGYRRALTIAQEAPESMADEELRRFVHVTDTHDGMVRIEAQLRPEEAAIVMRALAVARRRAWRSREVADHGVASAAGIARSNGSVVGVDRRHTENGMAPSEHATDVSAETSLPPRYSAQDRYEPRTPLARSDALVAIAEAYLASEAYAGATRGADTGANPVELVVHVDEGALRADPNDHASFTHHHATVDDGTAIGRASCRERVFVGV